MSASVVGPVETPALSLRPAEWWLERPTCGSARVACHRKTGIGFYDYRTEEQKASS